MSNAVPDTAGGDAEFSDRHTSSADTRSLNEAVRDAVEPDSGDTSRARIGYDLWSVPSTVRPLDEQRLADELLAALALDDPAVPGPDPGETSRSAVPEPPRPAPEPTRSARGRRRRVSGTGARLGTLVVAGAILVALGFVARSLNSPEQTATRPTGSNGTGIFVSTRPVVSTTPRPAPTVAPSERVVIDGPPGCPMHLASADAGGTGTAAPAFEQPRCFAIG
jgi:hypothetical protein